MPYDNLDDVPHEMLVRILEALGSGARKSHNPEGRPNTLSYLVDKILTLGRLAPLFCALRERACWHSGSRSRPLSLSSQRAGAGVGGASACRMRGVACQSVED